MSANHRLDRSQLYKDQLSGIAVQAVNDGRLQDEVAKFAAQDLAFNKAVEQLNQVRLFLESPDRILGSELTKHGEIAEHLEVGVCNARAALSQKEMVATFDGVGRTAPEDYLINGVAVQSKFINGVNNNLDAVLEHMERYSNFGRDGSYYHIPRDSYEIISRIMTSDDAGLSTKTVSSIREKIQEIQSQSGHTFAEVVKPGVSDYPEVQQGRIFSTLDRHESDLEQENNRLKEEIHQNHEPNLQNAATAAVLAAGVGGSLSLTISLYGKYKKGKNPFKGDFSADDWKSVGIDTAQGACLGAVTAGTVYLMTNYVGMSAPFAAAVVSASKGVGVLVTQLDAGEIDFDQFLDLGMILCSESAIVGIAAVLGQTAIPIPLVGAVIGSLAGRILAEFATGKTARVSNRVHQEMEEFLDHLDATLQRVFRRIDAEFERLGILTEAAFDLERNRALLESSVELARSHGVPASKIIMSHDQLDDFMLS